MYLSYSVSNNLNIINALIERQKKKKKEFYSIWAVKGIQYLYYQNNELDFCALMQINGMLENFELL